MKVSVLGNCLALWASGSRRWRSSIQLADTLAKGDTEAQVLVDSIGLIVFMAT